jgi:hypothetical protein
VKLLIGIIVYNRLQNANLWLKAYHNAEPYGDPSIVIVHNHDGPIPHPADEQYIIDLKPTYYYPRPNIGQDIGALRDTITNKDLEPWDILLWCTDDNIPVNKYFMKAFVEPFEQNPKMGLVGNYWVKSEFYWEARAIVKNHFRTSAFAISHSAAKTLQFSRHIVSKSDCWSFEWHSINNMTAQIQGAGFDTKPVCGDWDKLWVDCNEYIWDIGHLNHRNKDPRCHKNCWDQYNGQFRS